MESSTTLLRERRVSCIYGEMIWFVGMAYGGRTWNVAERDHTVRGGMRCNFCFLEVCDAGQNNRQMDRKVNE